MALKSLLILIFLSTVSLMPATGQLVKVDDFTPRRTDTIILERNWRTRDRIILAELEFAAGDTVTPENLGKSLKKIWNLQNFASVEHRWDSLPDGRSALILTARDALTIIPIFGGRFQLPVVTPIYGSDDHAPEFTAKLGMADRNFLGRNIRFEFRAQVSVREPWYGEVKLTIPRQLLWKNMSVGAGYQRAEFPLVWDIADLAYINMVNPFHEDYRYTFSPDLETGWIRHTGMLRLKYPEDAYPEGYEPYSRSFWFFRVTESLGTLTHRRHQEDGLLVTAMAGTAIALNAEATGYFEGSLRADYNKLISRRLQFNAEWEGHASTSQIRYEWRRYGPGNIRGIRYGDLTGPFLQLASAGFYYTWLNRDYLAIEQSIFVQYASAWSASGAWPDTKRHYAIGTGFRFTMPMYPAASFLVSFSLNPNRKNWFYAEM